MKPNIILYLLQLPILILASNIKNLVIFGDSNSDVGIDQRLSNGPLWSEYLAGAWNASLYSFAYSDSVCDNNMYPNTNKTYVPSFKDQVEAYYQSGLNLNPSETVYGIWFGLHDVSEMTEGKDKQELGFEQIAECVGQTLRSINKVFQANKFLVFNIPPLEYMPYYYNTEQASNKSQAAIEINRMLEKDVSNINKHHHALEMDLVDIHSLVNDIVVDPFIFNYKYATTSIITDCVKSGEPCSSSDEYIWWDDTHFSTAFHATIATSIVESESFTPNAQITKEPNVHSERFSIEPSKGIIDELVREHDMAKNKVNTAFDTSLEDEIYSSSAYTYEHLILIIFILVIIFAFVWVKAHKRMRTSLNHNNQGN